MNILHIILKRDSIDTIKGVFRLSELLNKYGCKSSIVGQNTANMQEELVNENFSQERNIIRVLFAAERIIKQENIDIIHAHSPLAGWLAFKLCRKYHKKWIMTCNGFYPRKISNLPIFLAKEIIVHSEALGKYLIDRFKIDFNQICHVSHTVDIKGIKFSSPDQRSKTEFNIGMLSPLIYGKGHEVFLKAMTKVVRIMPNTRIRILRNSSPINNGYAENVKGAIRTLGLTDHVQSIDYSLDTYKLCSDLNLLVMPSVRDEANTRIIVEAQSQGIPVIASSVAGIAELIDNGNSGILVSPGDHRELSNTIIKALKDISFLRHITKEARLKVEQDYDGNKNITKIIDMYERIKTKNVIAAITIGAPKEIIAAMPSLRLLKKTFPESCILDVASLNWKSLLDRCPFIDSLIILDEHKFFSIGWWIKAIRAVLRRNCDIVIDFTNSISSHIICFFSLASRRYGYANGKLDFLLNYKVKKNKEAWSLARRNYAVISQLGIKDKPRSEFWIPSHNKEFVKKFLEDNWIGQNRLIGIDVSGAQKELNQKRILENLVYLCHRFSKEKARVVVTCLDENKDLKQRLSRLSKSKPILAIGTLSFEQMISLMKKFDMYLSFNSEHLHIAHSAGVPNTALLTQINKPTCSLPENITIVNMRDIKRFDENRRVRKATFNNEEPTSIFEQLTHKLFKAHN